jgi:hypothetical protein
LLEIEPNLVLTEDFEKVPENTLNFREAISPKKHRKNRNRSAFSTAGIYPGFSEKFGFVPNLSILDLLFNEGPNSLNVLETSILKLTMNPEI